MKQNTSIHMIFNAIISVLALASLVFVVIFAFEFYNAITAEESDLGTGLSAVISLIFMFIFDIAMLILGILGSVWSFVIRKRCGGVARKWFSVFLTSNISSSLVGVILTVVMLILNKNL